MTQWSKQLSIPDYQTLMLPVLRVAAEGETRVPVAAEKIADLLGLTVKEREQVLPSGRQRLLHNRIHWAKFYMTKAGLIDAPKRGVFKATDLGLQLLKQSPAKIDLPVLRNYPSFNAFYDATPSAIENLDQTAPSEALASSKTPQEQIESAQMLMHAALQAELLQRIGANSPSFFEGVIVDLLVAMGYGGSHEAAALKIGKSGDNGVDGVISEDRLGLDRIYVQAKRYAPHLGVGRPEIQAFVGSLVGFGASKGVFVTTSYFSNGATDYVRHLPQRVVLIDGRKLAELMVEHEVGARIHQTVHFKRIDEDFFAEE